MRALVDEATLLTTRVALCNPPGAKHFALTPVDESPSQPADERVPQIARALNITPQQRAQLGQLRSLFLGKLGGLGQARGELNTQLMVSGGVASLLCAGVVRRRVVAPPHTHTTRTCTHAHARMPPPHPQAALPGGTSNRGLAGRYLGAHDALRRYRESLREEHILVLDFASTIFKHVSRVGGCVGGWGWVGGAGGCEQILVLDFAYTICKHVSRVGVGGGEGEGTVRASACVRACVRACVYAPA